MCHGIAIMLSRIVTTIWLFASLSQELSLSLLPRRSTTIPAPLSVPATTFWEGIDGTWNTFALQVGTPAQVSRVMISTASQESFVIDPLACRNTTKPQCDEIMEARGGVYSSNTSTTYESQGIFQLRIEGHLGYIGSGQFGYENVALGYKGEGMPLLKHQIIGSLAVPDFWYGHFGLHPKSTNFTDILQNMPSYMTTLFQQRLIPSVSWGYTAGAYYRFARVYASLTLGGYDKNRIIPNNVVFTMGTDNERELLVFINNITVEGTSQSLLPTPHYSFIDSTVAEIWLPDAACKLFEKEFGLTWDNATSLYFVSDAQHDILVARSANITFSLSTAPGIQEDVQIKLPYAAFDAIAKPPYRKLNSTQRYFPLRKAMNDTQYTLGRTFLQEAYLIVDWERENFRVSQCAWLPNNQKSIIPIRSTNTTMYPSLQGGPKAISGGVIAGIVIGVSLLILVLGAVAFYLWRRNKRREHLQEEQEILKREAEEKKQNSLDRSSTLVVRKHELDASDETAKKILEKDSECYKTPLVEAPENVIHELPGDLPDKAEADGRELSEKEAIRSREHRYNGVEEPIHTTSPISPMSPGDQTGSVSSPSDGGTLVPGRSPISPLTGGTLTDGAQNQDHPQQAATRQRINPADVQIVNDGGCTVNDGGASAAAEAELQSTPGELLEGPHGWSQLPERAANVSSDRKRFSFER